MTEFYYETPVRRIRAFKVIYEPYSRAVLFEFLSREGLMLVFQAEMLLDDLIMDVINRPDLKQIEPFPYEMVSEEGRAERLFQVFCEGDPDNPDGLPKLYLGFKNRRYGGRAREELVPLGRLLEDVLGRCRVYDEEFRAANPKLRINSQNPLQYAKIIYGL